MSDTCDCGGPIDDESNATRADGGGDTGAVEGRWLTERPVTEASLPGDLSGEMSRLLGRRVATLGEFAAGVREVADGAAPDVDDLCHADGETPHRAAVGGETYHFLCFYDAVVLAALTDRQVEFRTESPDGDVVEGRADPDGGVAVDPPDAVMSFGVATDLGAEEEPTPADMYSAVCPYVKAFEDRATFERWAAATDAATVGLPLADGTAFAGELVE